MDYFGAPALCSRYNFMRGTGIRHSERCINRPSHGPKYNHKRYN